MSLANVPTLFGLPTCHVCETCHKLLDKAGIQHNYIKQDFETRVSEYLGTYPELLLPSGEKMQGIKEIRKWIKNNGEEKT